MAQLAALEKTKTTCSQLPTWLSKVIALLLPKEQNSDPINSLHHCHPFQPKHHQLSSAPSSNTSCNSTASRYAPPTTRRWSSVPGGVASKPAGGFWGELRMTNRNTRRQTNREEIKKCFWQGAKGKNKQISVPNKYKTLDFSKIQKETKSKPQTTKTTSQPPPTTSLLVFRASPFDSSPGRSRRHKRRTAAVQRTHWPRLLGEAPQPPFENVPWAQPKGLLRRDHQAVLWGGPYPPKLTSSWGHWMRYPYFPGEHLAKPLKFQPKPRGWSCFPPKKDTLGIELQPFFVLLATFWRLLIHMFLIGIMYISFVICGRCSRVFLVSNSFSWL